MSKQKKSLVDSKLSREGTGTNLSIISEDDHNKIKGLYDQMKPGNEFEFMMFNFNNKHFTLEKYIALIKFLTYRSKIKKHKMESENVLDINYTNEATTYRLTIGGINDINETIQPFHKYANHVTFKTLALKVKDKKNKDSDKIKLMKKVKDKEHVVDIDDINLRIRLSEETDVNKAEFDEIQNLNYESANKIVFRLKQRVSFFIYEKDDDFIKVDITISKTTKNVNRINSVIPNYELEIELGKSTKSSSVDYLGLMEKEVETILKIIQQSNYIVKNSIQDYVLNEYGRILGIDASKATSIEGRQAFSLEIHHVTEILPNKYAVTDKADGDRSFLIIIKNHVYMISTNLNVKDTGIELPKSLSSYNDTIIDGEFIFLPSRNRHLLMVFDCLFNSGQDMRKTVSFVKRLEQADKIINDCFVSKTQKGFTFKTFEHPTGEFNLSAVVKFHEKQIKEFMDNLNHDIEVDKSYPLIRRKYFIPVFGAKSWEIFTYSALIWNKFTEDKTIACPYLLDGLIYHPLEQEYITNVRESKLAEYKWKPPTKNSIDFYIQFERAKDTGKILTIYDNSDDSNNDKLLETANEDIYVRNKPYKICNLHVGQRGLKGEQPALFREEDMGYLSYIYLTDGEVLDQEGNILTDNTVVEFYYNSDPEVNEKYRWVPIRTRYDKTEAVQRFGRKYGNYIDVAMKVWRSIVNPILMSDFEDLSRGNDIKTGIYYYDKKIELLREKIGHDLIISASKENVYFQVKTNLAKPMKSFHNYIKSITMYTHMSPMYQGEKQLSVLDLSCGRGSDIMRFYYSKVAFCVGVDIDKQALVGAVDGAISRYKKMSKSKPGFPKMYFIQADAGAPLTYEDQFRALQGMNKENADLIKKFFPTEPSKKVLFDRINCQFAMHYFLKNQDTWNNFKQNLNNCLKPGGYYLASTFDGKRIVDLLKDSDNYNVHYTNSKGEKKSLFEIVKKYGEIDANKPIGVGHAIDVFLAWIFQEGNYQTEYLVDTEFLRQELLRDCDLELVDTDTFDNIMEMQREWFMKYADYESNEQTRKFFSDAREYYASNDVNKGCYQNTKLYRYFIFRKKDDALQGTNKANKADKKQKGGSLDITDMTKFNIANLKRSSHSYLDSIHNLLKSHKLIPGSLLPKDFFGEFGMTLVADNKLNTDQMKKVSDSLQIYHEEEDGEQKKILDGLNVIIVETDCNNHIDAEMIKNSNKSDKQRSVILYKTEDNMYKPVYRLTGDGKTKQGIFSNSDPLIKQLIDDNEL